MSLNLTHLDRLTCCCEVWGLLLLLLQLLLLDGEVVALIAVPVSCAIGVGVFDAVSEIADAFAECSVTECELGVRVVALVRWQIDVDENASLVVCEGER